MWPILTFRPEDHLALDPDVNHHLRDGRSRENATAPYRVTEVDGRFKVEAAEANRLDLSHIEPVNILKSDAETRADQLLRWSAICGCSFLAGLAGCVFGLRVFHDPR